MKGQGGALFIETVSASVNRTVFTNNFAWFGGAVRGRRGKGRGGGHASRVGDEETRWRAFPRQHRSLPLFFNISLYPANHSKVPEH